MYEVIFVGPIAVPMEDPIVHSEARPVCGDPTCPCHTEQPTLYTIIPDPHYVPDVLVLVLKPDSNHSLSLGTYSNEEQAHEQAKRYDGDAVYISPDAYQQARKARVVAMQDEIVTAGGHTRKQLERLLFASRLDAFFTSMAYLVMQKAIQGEQEAWAGAFGDGEGC